MKKKLYVSFTVLLIVALFISLTGCVPGDGANSSSKMAGFFWGVWHGWIAPISIIMGFVNRNIRVYEVANTGWWYDFGFYIAIISGFGGLSLFRKKNSNKE